MYDTIFCLYLPYIRNHKFSVMHIFPEGTILNDKYIVRAFIKANDYAATYRATMPDDSTPYFLKVFDINAIPQDLLSDKRTVVEIDFAGSPNLKHKNIITFIDRGETTIDGVDYQFLVTEYFRGSLLADRLRNHTALAPELATQIILGVLEGLNHLSSLQLSHNDICPRNIMLEENEDGSITPIIIDLGHLSTANILGSPFFPTNDLFAVCRAPETFLGIYDTRSDMYSAGVVLYYMLFGRKPWDVSTSDCADNAAEVKRRIKEARKNEISYESASPIPQHLIEAIKRALQKNSNDRFNNYSDFINAVKGEEILNDIPKEDVKPQSLSGNDTAEQSVFGQSTASADPAKDFGISTRHGNGFKDIAGMESLKEMLNKKVIFVLKNKEKAEKYKITPPNGMLLYGPPGCGKTFFAEKFAEEAGFNYSFIKASDLASIYIHGSQGMIADLFKQAEAKKPVVLCFDEFDAMVPKRQGSDNNNIAGEVNEFLSQLNNCAKRGLFVIGTSNRPDRIDTAVLRKGRIDTLVYVPLPDLEARKAMFQLYLKDRPCDEIDFDALAAATENYVSSDIAFIANDAAMIAAFADVNITQTHLMDSIKSNKPSLTAATLREYEELREKMEEIAQEETERKRVGFKIND